MLDESHHSGINQSTVNMLTHGQNAVLKTATMAVPQHKENESKYVQAKTLAEMEFDVEEYKNPKEDGGALVEMQAKFKKIKKGLAQIMKDKKPAKRNAGPAQDKLFNPTIPMRKQIANRRGKTDVSVPVKLYISGRNLKDLDMFSKSDPICIVSERAQDNPNLWFEVGRTEFQKDNLNPDFKKPIDIDYFFEREQLLKFEFIDDDGGDDDDPYYDIIGVNTMQLASIMAARGQTLTKALVMPDNPNKQRGMVIVKAESIKESNHQISFQLFAKNLRNKVAVCGGIMWFNGRTQWSVERQSQGINQDVWTQVFLSEIKHGQNLKFRKAKLQLQQICNSDETIPIRICIIVDGHNVSYAQTTVKELRTNQNLQLKLHRNGQNGGEIFLSNFQFSENPNFAEYLRSGWQMSLSVAIDFTASNGKVTDPKSLHFPGSLTNEYEQAIIQVGNILQTYDHFKQFPVFGFGGIPKYLDETEVNHCFPLNGQFEQPEVNGVDGIVEAYRKHLREIQFAGPTFFSSILDIFMDFATEGEELKTYFVLLILTDGNIHDMKETVELVVDASRLPCSIIIVGVGNSNFDQMVELDSDENLLRDHKNRFAKRDIVQFVKYREAIARNNLAEELLKEIPNQVCRYMENIGYKPVPIQTDMQKIEESVQKQLKQIMEKKGINVIDTEAKDVIDKKALYGDTVVTADNNDDLFNEEKPKRKKKKKGANKIGALENLEDAGFFQSPADPNDYSTQQFQQINPSKLPKL